MARTNDRDGRAATAAPHLVATLLSRFEALVSPLVLDQADRRRQARVLAGLVGGGLACAAALPAAGIAQGGLALALPPTLVAGLCLGLAAALAATGAVERVLGAAVTGVAALAAAGALATGGLVSPLLALLLLAPVEAMFGRNRRLAGLAFGMGSLALAAVAGGEWLGLAERFVPPAMPLLASVAGAAWAATLGLRLRGRIAARRRTVVRHAAEAQLLEDALSEAVLRFDARGTLLSASRAAEAVLGFGGTIDGNAILSRIHVTDRVGYLKSFGDLRAGADVATAEIRMARGGGFGEIALTLHALRGEGRRLVSILVFARDVTEERRRMAALTEALAEARRASDAKSHFLAAVSHELRTPLNAIIGFSDVLDQEFFGSFENPRQKEYVGLIRQSGEHLLGVVNGLLDISKIEAGRYELQPERFLPDDMLKAAVETMREAAERKGLVLGLRSRCALGELVADPRACHQILLNLLSNAVKFTDAGSVTVEAGFADGAFQVSVRDTGIGIAPDDLPRLGQPFTQLSAGLTRHYGGTGLGLSLVKGLAELHHGTMEIESESGRGTCVTVRIPLDCARRIEEQKTSKENVVALTDARKKPHAPSPDHEARRSA